MSGTVRGGHDGVWVCMSVRTVQLRIRWTRAPDGRRRISFGMKSYIGSIYPQGRRSQAKTKITITVVHFSVQSCRTTMATLGRLTRMPLVPRLKRKKRKDGSIQIAGSGTSARVSLGSPWVSRGCLTKAAVWRQVHLPRAYNCPMDELETGLYLRVNVRRVTAAGLTDGLRTSCHALS